MQPKPVALLVYSDSPVNFSTLPRLVLLPSTTHSLSRWLCLSVFLHRQKYCVLSLSVSAGIYGSLSRSAVPYGFEVSRIKLLCFPACRKRQVGDCQLELYNPWWKCKNEDPSRGAREMARPSRDPERSSSPSSTVIYMNYFEKTTCFMLTIYG